MHIGYSVMARLVPPAGQSVLRSVWAKRASAGESPAIHVFLHEISGSRGASPGMVE